MDKKPTKYSQMERFMTIVLLADTGLFCLYLLFAGLGVLWLKAVAAVLAVIISGLSLAYLYITKELLKRRSLWMTASAAAIFVCILFSLVLNYPSSASVESENNTTASNITAYILDEYNL